MARGSRLSVFVLVLASLILPRAGSADDTLDKLFKAGEYQKAIQHADQNLPAKDRTIEEWLLLGESYLQQSNQKGAVEKARECFVQAQKINPSHPRVFLGFGRQAAAAGQLKKALDHYQKAYLLQRDAVAAEGIARTAYALKDWDKALDAAESAVHLDSSVFEPRRILAELYLRDKNWRGAAAQLEAIVRHKPKNVRYWKDLARCYVELKDREKLAKVDPQIIKLDSKEVDARRRFADYSLAKKDTATAFTLYKELAVLTPQSAPTFKHLYQISQARGDKKDATLYLKNYLVLDSTNAPLQLALGNLLYEQNDLDGALEAYRTTLKLEPKAKGLYRNYMEILFRKKLDNEAVARIEGATAAGEANARMYALVGDILKKKGKHAEAVEKYQASLRKDAKNIRVLTSLAESQAEAGKQKEAVQTYEQVVLLNPKATTEFKELGNLQMGLGRTKAAIATYKKYLTKDPSDGKVARTIGLYEHENERYSDAVRYLEMVKDAGLHSVTYLAALGESYFAGGNFKGAADAFHRCRAKKPSNDVLKRILRPLAESYEKTGDKMKAARAYNAYVQLPGVSDADAAFMRAYLREKEDRAMAVKMYTTNVKNHPKDYRSFYRLGMIYAQSEQTLPQAASMLDAASKLVDSLAGVWRTLAEVSGKLKRESSELAAYQKLLELKPQDLVANRRVGAILMKRGETAKAITNLEMVLTSDSKDVETMLLLADGYTRTKRPAQAAAHLKKAKTLKPDDVAIRLALIDAYTAAENKAMVKSEKDDLAKLDAKIIAKDKKDVDSRVRLAEYSMKKKDYKTAYPIYKELAVLTPKDETVFKSLYTISLHDNDKREAVEHLRKYLALKPSEAEAHRALGNLLYDLKNNNEALEAYRAALKNDPKITGFYKAYVDIVLQKKLDDEAITAIKGAIAAGEADARAYAALGDIYKKRKRYSNAIAMYQEALKTDTKNMAVLTSLAESQAKNGALSDAVISYEQVVMLNPKAREEIKELGDLHMRLKKVDNAMAAYKKYLVKAPDDEAIAKKIGLYEHAKKQYRSAIKYLEMVKKTELQDVQYLSALGDAYYQSGDCKKTTELFAKAHGKNPDAAIQRSILPPLAECYEKTNKPVQAARAYEDYTKVATSRDPDAYFKMAFLREKTDQATAIRIYQNNVKLFPKDHRNFTRLGLIYAADGKNLKTAAAVLKSSTELVDTIPEVWRTLGEVYGKLKWPKSELGAYQKYLTLAPQDVTANRRVGQLLLDQGKLTQAITNLEMVLTTETKDAETMLALAGAYEKTRRPAKSIELLSKAKQLKPKDVAIRERLYELHEQAGKKQPAEQEIKDLIALTKENKYRLLYGEDLMNQSRFQEAEAVARQVKSSNPMSVDGLMMLGDVQREQNKYFDAIETYKSVLYIKDKYAPALYGRAEAYLGEKNLNRAQEYFEKALKADAKMAAAEFGLAKVAKAKGDNTSYVKHLNKAAALDPKDTSIREAMKAIKQ